MDRTELAWAAGFWDGEGSAWLTQPAGRSTAQPHARINQAGTAGVPTVLVRFRNAVGVGRIQGPYLEDGKEPLYKWVVSSRDEVRATFVAIGRWLGTVKRAQFMKTLSITHDGGESQFGVDDEWLAWCAGLFDGEGSVYLLKHGSHAGYFVIEAAITQSSWHGVPQVLDRFRNVSRLARSTAPIPAANGMHLFIDGRLIAAETSRR